jgi:hypothetical protein
VRCEIRYVSKYAYPKTAKQCLGVSVTRFYIPIALFPETEERAAYTAIKYSGLCEMHRRQALNTKLQLKNLVTVTNSGGDRLEVMPLPDA